MSASEPLRTTLGRATAAGYDEQHEREIANAILTTILETSRVSDANCVALRTAESASALVSCLAIILAMSPASTRSPTAQRELIDELRKRLRRRVARATTDETLQELLRRSFNGGDVGGHA